MIDQHIVTFLHPKVNSSQLMVIGVDMAAVLK